MRPRVWCVRKQYHSTSILSGSLTVVFTATVAVASALTPMIPVGITAVVTLIVARNLLHSGQRFSSVMTVILFCFLWEPFLAGFPGYQGETAGNPDVQSCQKIAA